MKKKIIGLIAIVFVISVVLGYIYYRSKYINTPIETQVETLAALDSDITVEDTKNFPLQVLTVKPDSGIVKTEVNQITVVFNKPMIPLGDFEKLALNLPIKIMPEIPCHWRWLNRTTLSCELDNSLPLSNKYNILIGTGFKAFDGTTLKDQVSTTFSTEVWKVIYQDVNWIGPTRPELMLIFNQPMDLESLKKALVVSCKDSEIVEVTEEESKKKNLEYERSYIIKFKKDLAYNEICNIKIDSSAKSKLGIEPGELFNTQLTMFDDFKISKVGCENDEYVSNANLKTISLEKCNPDYGLTIYFSAPIYGKDLADNIKVDPFFGWMEGGRNSPEYFRQNPDQEYDSITLSSPMNGRSKHVISIKNLKDRFGRNLTGADSIVLTTGDFSPIFNFPSGFGVIEKDGPKQYAYSAVNISTFTLDYFFSRNVNDISFWEKQNDYNTSCEKPLLVKSTKIKTGLKLNLPETLPLDIEKLVSGSSTGLFFGWANDPEYISPRTISTDPIRCSPFFLEITDLGITAKVGFFDSAVWIHSIKTGKPLEDVRISFKYEGKIVSRGTTDENGFVKLTGAKDFDPEREGHWKSPLYIVAETKDDLSILPFNEGRTESYYYNEYLPYGDRLRESNNHLVSIITDRPLYKPGEDVKLKVFARSWDPKSFVLKPDEKIEIRVKDPFYKDVFVQEVKMSSFGTASFEFKLNSGMKLGTYTVDVKIGNWNTYVGEFKVQEFTLPAFKVKIDSQKGVYKTGEIAQFKALATYHFGGGLAGAKGDYTATFDPGRWMPKIPQWQAYTFDNPMTLMLKGYEKPIEKSMVVIDSGSAKTTKNGDALINIVLGTNQIRSFGKLNFEIKFQDDRGKAIAQNTSLDVHSSDIQLGIKTPKWSYEAGKTIEPQVIALNIDEKSVSDKKVKLNLVYRQFKTVRMRSSGNYYNYVTRTKDEIIDSCEFESESEPSGCSLKTKASGMYYITAETKDSKSRLISTSMSVYVTGSNYVGWFKENTDSIDLIPDKNEYIMGETAKLLVKNPFSEVDALVTYERFGILKSFRKKLVGGASIIEIPLDESVYSPGFNVAVQIIRGRTSDKIEGAVDLGKPAFKSGTVRLNVIDPDTKLTLDVKSKREEIEPGEEALIELKITSKTIHESELMVAVVDDKILQLAGDYTDHYDLHSKVYKMPFNDVETSQLLKHLIGRRHFGRKGAPAGGDGGDSVRKNFLPVAYFNPAILVGTSGQTSIKFKVPDNLTTWTVLVVAVDQSHRFGFGRGSFRVAKKFMIESALPSFLTEGDRFTGRFVAFNKTGKTADVTGELKISGASLEGQAKKSIQVNNDNKTYFEWPLTVTSGSKVIDLTALGEANGYKDAIKIMLPVLPYLSYETFATSGSTTNASAKIPLEIPKEVRNELSSLSVLVSPTLIAQLDDVFRYVFSYPYSCWEQTLTRILAYNSYRELESYMSLSPGEIGGDINKKISELLALMPKFQAPNGGMSYWLANDRTVDPYLSVYTALGLIWLNRSNIDIPKDTSQKLFNYVKAFVRGNFKTYYGYEVEATVKAMAVYVTTILGEKDIASVNKIYGDKDRMSLFGQAFLLMAADKHTETKQIAEAIKKKILGQSNSTSNGLTFTEKLDGAYNTILSSSARTDCTILSAFMETDSSNTLIQPLVNTIMTAKKSGRWNNTQENLFCMNGLIQYARVYEKDKPDFQTEIFAFGKKIDMAKFKGFKEKPVEKKYTLPLSVIGTTSSVELARKGVGRMYYTARLRIAYEKVRTDPVNAGMQVERSYHVKDSKGKWIKKVGEIKIKRGDLVRIDLLVKVPALRYQVALVDSLPAGLEPLNTELAGTSKSDADIQKKSSRSASMHEDMGDGEDDYFEDDWWYFFWDGGFYHKEMRLTGLQTFARHLVAKQYNISYVAQAVATGEFSAGPALVEEMYSPEVYGKSTPAKFIIGD